MPGQLHPKFALMMLGGVVGDYCRSYYQSEHYIKCAEDENCRKTNDDYYGCCEHFNYCNFYSTNWFFWLIFFLILFMIGGSIGFCVWRIYRKRKAGRGDDEDEPSDTI